LSAAFKIGVAGLVAVGLAYRLAVIASPLGEIDGDEARYCLGELLI
jgi:hypothetical protein